MDIKSETEKEYRSVMIWLKQLVNTLSSTIICLAFGASIALWIMIAKITFGFLFFDLSPQNIEEFRSIVLVALVFSVIPSLFITAFGIAPRYYRNIFLERAERRFRRYEEVRNQFDFCKNIVDRSLVAYGLMTPEQQTGDSDALESATQSDAVYEGINFEVIHTAYDWGLSNEGELLGLTAGDMYYEPTGIHLNEEFLEIWELGLKALDEKHPETDGKGERRY